MGKLANSLFFQPLQIENNKKQVALKKQGKEEINMHTWILASPDNSVWYRRTLLEITCPCLAKVSGDLERLGFYTAKGEGVWAYEGGLFDHSLSVARTLDSATTSMGVSLLFEGSPNIVGFLHEVACLPAYRELIDAYGLLSKEEMAAIDAMHAPREAARERVAPLDWDVKAFELLACLAHDLVVMKQGEGGVRDY